MDSRLYAQEIEASFELASRRVYHAFSRDLNVCDVHMVPDLALLVGMDFNVDPMTAVVAHRVGAQCHISAEIVLPNSNTFEMMQELLRRYPEKPVRRSSVESGGQMRLAPSQTTSGRPEPNP